MPRTKDKSEEIRENRLKQIREESLKQFSTKGLEATKIKDIANALNISQGLIYHYYDSKEDIFIELVNDSLDKMNEAALYLKKLDMQPDEKLKLAIEKILLTIENSESFDKICRIIVQSINTESIPKEAKCILNEKRNIPYIEIADIIAEGQSLGKILDGDPMEMAVAFWTSINGIALYKATNESEVYIPKGKILERMFIKE